MHHVIDTLVAVAAALYAIGALRLRRRAATARGNGPSRAASFTAASGVVLILFGSAFDALTHASFAAHMLQHEMLMVVAAPLFVFAHPAPLWLWAFPSSWRARIANALAVGFGAAAWRRLTQPVVATGGQLAALWVWHVPRFFDAAMRDPWLHVAQHTTFFVAALAFWTSLWSLRRRRNDIARIAMLFVTMLATGALGALLTFARTPWYTPYANHALGQSPTPLEDQQLGGLVMWIVGGLPYIAAALWIVARALTVASHPPGAPSVVRGA